MLIRPKKPSREELARIFKDPRVLKAFEQVFDVVPGELNRQDEEIENVLFAADSAATQAALAIALIQAVEALAEIKAMEPVHQCSCQFDDLTPRHEHIQIESPEPTQISYHEISTLEIV